MKSYKSLLCLLLSFLLLLPLFCMPALAEEADETQDTALTLSCPSAVLMEASTGWTFSASVYREYPIRKGCGRKTSHGKCDQGHDPAFDL